MHNTNLVRLEAHAHHLLQARWTFTLGSRPSRPSPRPSPRPTCRATRVRCAPATQAPRASPAERLEARMERMVTDQRRQQGRHQSAMAKVKHEATEGRRKTKRGSAQGSNVGRASSTQGRDATCCIGACTRHHAGCKIQGHGRGERAHTGTPSKG